MEKVTQMKIGSKTSQWLHEREFGNHSNQGW